MKNLMILSVVCALGAYAQVPPEWKAGTLTRITSGDAYLEASVGAPATTYQPSRQIGPADQVYVIVGGGMEYVVAESERSTAHVIINAAILYKIEDGRFIFADQEGMRHSARIARQTLIDPTAIQQPLIRPAPIAPRPAPSTDARIWRSTATQERFYVRRTNTTIDAKRILDRGSKAVSVEYEGTLASENNYFGQAHWTEGPCPLSADVMFTVQSQDRMMVTVETGTRDRKTCALKNKRYLPFVWVPE